MQELHSCQLLTVSTVPFSDHSFTFSLGHARMSRWVSFRSPFVQFIMSYPSILGPTAIASLLTYQTARGSWQKACLLCFLTGITELLMGFFGLGFLIDFVSGPVSSGFTSAVALIILSSQVKDIFGIKASGTTFVQMWSSIIDNIGGIRVWDTMLGFACIVILLLMRVSFPISKSNKQSQLKFPLPCVASTKHKNWTKRRRRKNQVP